MKHILVTAISILFCLSVSAQINYDDIAEKTCKCLKSKNFKDKTKKEIEMELGLCMISAANSSGAKINLSDDSFMEKLGEEIGLRMVNICPDDFMKIYSVETKDGKTLLDEYVPDDASISVSGTVSKVSGDELLFIHVKELSGKEHKVLLLNYVANVDAYLDDPSKLVGKKVKISYLEKEYYSMKFKEYVKLKEVSSINFE